MGGVRGVVWRVRSVGGGGATHMVGEPLSTAETLTSTVCGAGQAQEGS